MADSHLKTLWASGGVAMGAWCSMGSSAAAEFLASEGFDYVGIDCQHGLAGAESMVPMLQGIGRYPVGTVVRVPISSGWWIERALDCGAEAVIVPMVNNAREAADAVSHCRYPPLGQRSLGPIRAELVLGADPVAANRSVTCLVQIETAEAVENIDEICVTPGIDGVYIGPADLAMSMGIAPRLAPIPGPHAGAMDRVRAVCDAHGLITAVHSGSGEQAKQYADAGYRMITIGSDTAMLRSYARSQLRTARGK